MLIQEMMDFSYRRNDAISMWVDHSYFKKFPISYTLEECLEDYCIEHRWDFHHIQFGCDTARRNGEGRFYYYHMFEPKKSQEKRMRYSWFTQDQERRLCLDDSMSIPLREGDSVEDTLKKICRCRGWTFVSETRSYSSYQCGDGFLRYNE